MVLVFSTTSFWSFSMTRYALVRLIGPHYLHNRAHYRKIAQECTNKERKNYTIINQVDIITGCLLATCFDVSISYASRIDDPASMGDKNISMPCPT